ncbi:hypothetical protein VFPPC_12303 [Pochonia chlamydosporia 170]|uniref:Uncharacterized protein n=1 Tax=Pochonia chlamydosporia 170 TaxID=1380566 RepID=A0A179EVV8_METCM|nr:hypothetical protein VFPPC_12303 [Pochonia chlamydosporia 170]OAQ57311.1 hypothetical protein VFPPC_12303 [Pochonia chlamydosporia 170]
MGGTIEPGAQVGQRWKATTNLTITIPYGAAWGYNHKHARIQQQLLCAGPLSCQLSFSRACARFYKRDTQVSFVVRFVALEPLAQPRRRLVAHPQRHHPVIYQPEKDRNEYSWGLGGRNSVASTSQLSGRTVGMCQP